MKKESDDMRSRINAELPKSDPTLRKAIIVAAIVEAAILIPFVLVRLFV